MKQLKISQVVLVLIIATLTQLTVEKCDTDHPQYHSHKHDWLPNEDFYCIHHGNLFCHEFHEIMYWLIKNDKLGNQPLIFQMIPEMKRIDDLSRDIKPYEIRYEGVEGDVRTQLNEFGDILIFNRFLPMSVHLPKQVWKQKAEEAFEFLQDFYKNYPEYYDRQLLIVGDESLNEFTDMLVKEIDYYNRPRNLTQSVPENRIKLVSFIKIKDGHYIKANYKLKDEEMDSAFLNPEMSGTFLSGLDISFKLKEAIEFLWTWVNLNDFCLLPKVPTFALPFVQTYYRQFGIEMSEINQHLKSSNYFDRSYERSDHPLIPLKTHRVWITSRFSGTEIFSFFSKNMTLMDEMVRSNERMDDDHHKWIHYFWVNSKSAIPESVKWLEDNGFIVKELSELKLLDKDIEHIISEYEIDRFGAAADIARFAILYEEGGFYQDLDFFVNKWDNEIMHYFDSIHWKNDLGYDSWTMNTYSFLVKPRHEELRLYLETYKKHYYSKGTDDQPLHFSPCLDLTQGITLYETGPFFYTAIFIQQIRKSGSMKDIVLREVDASGPQSYFIKTNNNEVKEVSFWVKELGLGSWIDDYTDAMRFGFVN